MTVVLTWVVILSFLRGRRMEGTSWLGSQLGPVDPATRCKLLVLPFTFRFGQGSFCPGVCLGNVRLSSDVSTLHPLVTNKGWCCWMVLRRGNRYFLSLRCVEEMNHSHRWAKSKRKNPMSNSPSSYWGMKSALLNLLNLDVRWQRHSATSDSANIYLANILNNIETLDVWCHCGALMCSLQH